MKRDYRHFGSAALFLAALCFFQTALGSDRDRYRFPSLESFRENIAEGYRDDELPPDMVPFVEPMYGEGKVVSVVQTGISGMPLGSGIFNSVYVVWNHGAGIVAGRLAQISQNQRGGNDIKVKGVERWPGGEANRDIYAVITRERWHVVDNSEAECEISNHLYLVALDRRDLSIHLLTDEPIPLAMTGRFVFSEAGECYSARPDTLAVDAKNGFLTIRQIGGLIPEQRSWIGKYRTHSDTLQRAEPTETLHQRFMKADAEAIRLFRDGQVGRAAAVLRPLVMYSPETLDQKTVSAYNNYGFFLAESRRPASAIPVLMQVLEKFPERTVAHLNIADAYYSLRMKEQATAHYRRYAAAMDAAGRQVPDRVVDRLE